jgi:hypothetical protein
MMGANRAARVRVLGRVWWPTQGPELFGHRVARLKWGTISLIAWQRSVPLVLSRFLRV